MSFVTIAHAMGSIDGHKYTNSRQAFMANYARGLRYFEVDFALSSDGGLICTHPGEGLRYSEPTDDVTHFTQRQFLRLYIDEVYSTLNAEEVWRLMANYPDIYVVTDTKGWNDELVEAFSKELSRISPKLISRIILQIYRPEDYDLLSPLINGFDFHSIIYTLYLLDATYDNVLKFVQEKNINAIAVETLRLKRRRSSILWIKSHGVKVFVFTVNDSVEVESIKSLGLDGIYSDELLSE